MEFDDPSQSANSNATGTGSIASHDVPIFDHQPLDETKQQIRLLRIQKNRTSKELEYDIVTHDLDTVPKYIALSYVWGSPQPTYPLLIQGKHLHIRQNLHRFLHEYPDEGLLWIDQICIDQSNIHERNHQVNLMSRIYEQCEYVITWIGDMDGSDVCSTAAREFKKWFIPKYLVPILCNTYFTRLWIVQEILLAPSVDFFVQGGEWLRWSDIRRAVEHMYKDDMQQLHAARSVAVPLLRAWVRKDLKRRRDLDWLFRSFHTCDCENPRDKVFGLIGLASANVPGRGIYIQIDYSKSVNDLFSEVAMEWHRFYKAYLLPKSKSTRLQHEKAALREEELLKILSDLGLSMGLDKFTVEDAIHIAWLANASSACACAAIEVYCAGFRCPGGRSDGELCCGCCCD